MELEPEVVVIRRRLVLVHDEAVAAAGAGYADWLGRPREVSPRAVGPELLVGHALPP
jgi:hypothetical protein